MRGFVGWVVFALLVGMLVSIVPGQVYVIKGKRAFAAGRYEEAIADYQFATRIKNGHRQENDRSPAAPSRNLLPRGFRP